jgi:hypothetical protein
LAWEVLERVGLPVREERVVYTLSDGTEIKDVVATGEVAMKEPGDTITKAEMDAAGQTDEHIKNLEKTKAIKEKK